VHEEARSYRGFNFFDQDDEALFVVLARGEFTQQRPDVADFAPALRARLAQESAALLQVLPRRGLPLNEILPISART
jgi:hypothetical protein